ncbi:DUF4246 domain-containing protein [Streptomyces sp. KL116D]|uniref:DUF4246 domain-containing protein n=1 Tax=Streptomyces sp. KL116D TaxID=3045152 RepID=UPI0035580867
MRYVLAELAHYAALRDGRTGIEVSAVDGVWQSDTVVDEELRSRLREAVRVLEEVPDAEKDWHPGSDGQVLDLVHPSLFCLVNGVSTAPERAWRNPTDRYSKYEFSEKFQWLPRTSTSVPTATSPSARTSTTSTRAAPRPERRPARAVRAHASPLGERPHRSAPPAAPADRDRSLRLVRLGARAYPRKTPDGDDAAHEEAVQAWATAYDAWRENRHPVVPDAPAFIAPELPDDSARIDLRGRRPQVIAKLATIHLTPERPEYPGGSWHVEGMLNERIVSTGIYYWDSENITESRLSFPVPRSTTRSTEQNDDDGMREVYGLENEDALNQTLGSASTPAGRCLAFPNVLQHRVSPFRLADPARPGHRKILAFFLVDPSETIVSTSDVPPQQPWADTLDHDARPGRELPRGAHAGTQVLRRRAQRAALRAGVLALRALDRTR